MPNNNKINSEDAGRLPIPEVSQELVYWLQATHPVSVIKRGESMEEAQRRAGFQDCIDILEHYHALQELAAAGDIGPAEDLYYDGDASDTVEMSTGYAARLSQPRPPRR